jgi:hypothetical protein
LKYGEFYVIYAVLLLIGVRHPAPTCLCTICSKTEVKCYILESRALVWDLKSVGLIFLGTYCYKDQYVRGLIMRDIWLGYLLDSFTDI